MTSAGRVIPAARSFSTRARPTPGHSPARQNSPKSAAVDSSVMSSLMVDIPARVTQPHDGFCAPARQGPGRLLYNSLQKADYPAVPAPHVRFVQKR